MAEVVTQGPWSSDGEAEGQTGPALVDVEAEQHVLAMLLQRNRAYEVVEEWLHSDHFADALYGRIYAAIGRLIDKGSEATAVTVKPLLAQDDELKQAGGNQYLADLEAVMVLPQYVRHHARTVYDLYLRRQLVESGYAAIDSAHDLRSDTGAQALIEQFEGELAKLTAEGASDRMSTVADAGSDWLKQVEEAQRSGGGIVGVTTGLSDLDDALGGSVRGWMVVIGGRPGMGKTVLAMQLARAAAHRYQQSRGTEGGAAVVFSLEMSREQLVARIFAGDTGIPTDRQSEGRLSSDDWEALTAAQRDLDEQPLIIDDTPAITVQQMRSRLRRLQRKHRIRVVVVDYMQLMSASGQARRKDSTTAEVTELSRDLKALAQEFQVAVYPVSQLSRKVEQREDKRPQLADLRESGQIEQDADAIVFTYRESYYLERAEPKQRADEDDGKYQTRHQKWLERMTREANRAELILAKHRHRKFPRTVPVHFDKQRQLFGDLAEGHEQGEALP